VQRDLKRMLAYSGIAHVGYLGAPKARALAQELRADAHAALASLGSRGARLASLADFVVLRKF